MTMSTYAVADVDALDACREPRASAKRSSSMTLRSAWMSAPKKLALPRIILKPLSSAGLWLPVIITPPSVPSAWTDP